MEEFAQRIGTRITQHSEELLSALVSCSDAAMSERNPQVLCDSDTSAAVWELGIFAKK